MNYKKTLRNVKTFWKIAEINEIARRYFTMNIFDNVLMTLGILLASYFSNLGSKVIITTIIGAAIAVTVSGISGAYMAESAERKSKIKILDRKISISLKRSPIARAHKFAIFFLALVNGLPPLLVALFIILPFLFTPNLKIAYYISIVLAFSVLFFIGVFLGKLNKENLIWAGFKMMLVGIICATIIFLVQGR
ncbi:hypothetical protein FP803_01190 [Candidatus Woesearchaeota archaeon]|nr:hypothetical protein [Candidatus Woesearchaeota archaeon]